jgi:hypothetical protein
MQAAVFPANLRVIKRRPGDLPLPPDQTGPRLDLMHRGTWFGAVLLLAALVFQVWVTLRLRRTQIFDASQKRAQTKLIWLVPVLGAAIVFSVLIDEEKYENKDDQGQSS